MLRVCIYILFLIFILQYSVSSQTDCYVDIYIPSKVEAGKEYNIDIIVNKENISGFAKLEIYLPVGIDLYPLESGNATLIKQGQLAKYIWIELPQKNIITLKANIKVDQRISGYKEIYGNFHYIQGKNKSKLSIGIIPFMVLNDNSWKSKKIIAEEYPYNTTNTKIEPQNLSTEKQYYRIQIAAFKNKIRKEQLSEIYLNTSQIKEEFIDGLYKYTIGDFRSFEDAKNFKEQLGIYGAFIVYYENGKRSSLPEKK